ncbi:ADP-ribosylation factor-binding protein GGA3 [Alosa pseudoharengus]|uniref:ADP-ribosylation factor-binding protein GGA3 n=1 Tax=Alosa pseudoharengus TaxID=34774 RepID=UPI003F8868F6
MAYQEGESLESWLNKATHPTNRQEDWEYIIGFCDQINKELEGPQIAVKLLIHKIHSPQEWEALQALTVLEACMKNCGKRFHNEIAKYRFLNELIKAVSPKYLGDSVPEKVKTKIIEILYSWTVAFPNETKISDAYQTLRRQGLITSDPELPVDRMLLPSPPTRPKNPVFDNEDMGKLLAELLKSKNPEDLQEANRLIKSMVKEDDVRVQKMTKRMKTLEEVNNNVKLLSEMLSHYDKDRSSESDRDLIRELYDRCDKLRRTAFKLATETEDNDSSLGDILQASDDLSKVISLYRRVVEGQTDNGDSDDPRPAGPESNAGAEVTDTLIDLAGFDATNPPSPQSVPPPAISNLSPAKQTATSIPVLPPPPRRLAGPAGSHASQTSSPSRHIAKQSASLSLLDEELLSLGLNDPAPGLSNQTQKADDFAKHQWASLQVTDTGLDPFSLQATGPAFSAAQTSASVFPPTSQTFTKNTPSGHGLQDLSMLNLGEPKSLPAQPITGNPFVTASAVPVPLGHATPNPLLQMGALPGSPMLSHTRAHAISSAPGSPLFRSLSPTPSSLQGSPAKGPEISMTNLHVPLDIIKPSKVLPVTAYDKDGVRVLLHFASECPAGRTDVLVVVLSMLNTAPLPIRNVSLQAAVPKSMKVKLQPPSGTDLAPFNPILPPPSITQIMLLANPLREKVRLRFKLMFLLGERQYTEVGEVDQFPPPSQWDKL